MKLVTDLPEEKKLACQRAVYEGYTLRELPRSLRANKYRHDPRAPYFDRVVSSIQPYLKRDAA